MEEYTEDLEEKEKYLLLLNKTGAGLKPTYLSNNPTDKVVEPSTDDYIKGMMNRYFVAKANDLYSQIYEVTPAEYKQFQKNPFYVTATMRWKITGPLKNVYDRGILKNRGVIDFNMVSYQEIQAVMPRIDTKISALNQFHKTD